MVCATLSGCARSELSRFIGRFQACIVDEASQCAEPEAIVPLGMCRVERLILVGDPAQLPPTVVSGEAERAGLRISLMERLLHSWRAQQEAEAYAAKQLQLHSPSSPSGVLAQNHASSNGIATASMSMHMLVVQHRMHPTIRTFPSHMFYEGLLRDADHCRHQVRDAAQLMTPAALLGNFSAFDICFVLFCCSIVLP